MHHSEVPGSWDFLRNFAHAPSAPDPSLITLSIIWPLIYFVLLCIGFLNKAMADFGLQLDLGFLTKNRSYTFFKPQASHFPSLLDFRSIRLSPWKVVPVLNCNMSGVLTEPKVLHRMHSQVKVQNSSLKYLENVLLWDIEDHRVH